MHSKWKHPLLTLTWACLFKEVPEHKDLMTFIHTLVHEFLKLTTSHFCHGLTHLNSAIRCVLLCIGLGLPLLYCKKCVVWNTPMVRSMHSISMRPTRPLFVFIHSYSEYNIDKIHYGCIANFVICLIPRVNYRVFLKYVVSTAYQYCDTRLRIKSSTVLMSISQRIFCW